MYIVIDFQLKIKTRTQFVKKKIYFTIEIGHSTCEWYEHHKSMSKLGEAFPHIYVGGLATACDGAIQLPSGYRFWNCAIRSGSTSRIPSNWLPNVILQHYPDVNR